jgi:hypothetical protein
MLQIKFAEKTKTKLCGPCPFFVENRAVYQKMWENTVEPGRPDDNMAHAHCMLDT